MNFLSVVMNFLSSNNGYTTSDHTKTYGAVDSRQIHTKTPIEEQLNERLKQVREDILNEKQKPLQQLLKENRAPERDLDGRVLDEWPLAGNSTSVIDSLEMERMRFNTKYWVPEDKQKHINKEMLEVLHSFWNTLIDSYKTEPDSKDSESPSESEKESAMETESPSEKHVNYPRDKVLEFLKNSWREDLSDAELRAIQLKLEEMTIHYNETNIYDSAPQLKSLFFNRDRLSAKEFLMKHLKVDTDRAIVRAMGAYTLETVVIWVLSKHFNVFALEQKSVTLANLLGDLDKSVRELHSCGIEKKNKMKASSNKEQLEPAHDTKLEGGEPETVLATTLEGAPTVKAGSALESAVEGEGGVVDEKMSSDSPKQNNGVSEGDTKKSNDEITTEHYAIGSALFSWLYNNQLVEIYNPVGEVDLVEHKGKGQKYKTVNYVRCLFDIKDLPLFTALPMVYPPVDWKNRRPHWEKRYDMNRVTRKVRDLTGGYLKSEAGFSRATTLLSTQDEGHFNIYMRSDRDTAVLTSSLNKMQSVPYKINAKFLGRLRKNWDALVNIGLVMPAILASIRRKEGVERLRKLFLKNEKMKDSFDVNELISVWSKNIQSACYEQYLLQLAEALCGYKIYFPCFLDFRGRNYRYGPFHFHERDLVRSLILFAHPGREAIVPTSEQIEAETELFEKTGGAHTLAVDVERWVNVINSLYTATAFHFAKFDNYNEARDFSHKLYDAIKIPIRKAMEQNSASEREAAQEDAARLLMLLTVRARSPFQFLSTALSLLDDKGEWDTIQRTPINQDASASAYQIISYFLCDISMARSTNLIRGAENEDKIQDLYESLLIDFKRYVRNKCGLDSWEYANVDGLFNRDLIKKIFMPIVYGKTLHSTIEDVRVMLRKTMPQKDAPAVTKLCFEFWDNKYPGMRNLMRLISTISWVSGVLQKPVILSTSYWITTQDYLRMLPVSIPVKYRTHGAQPKKKKTIVTLRITGKDRDSRKSMNSTFANFIHQKDALTVINFVQLLGDKEMMLSDLSDCPIYTVHDNFITTPIFAENLPYIYRMSMLFMGHPLDIVNKFIYDNIILPAKHGAFDNLSSNSQRELERVRQLYDSHTPDSRRVLNITHTPYTYPEHFLEECLMALRPANKKLKKRWGDKTRALATYYREYYELFTTPKGKELWSHFYHELGRPFDPNIPDYCLHS